MKKKILLLFVCMSFVVLCSEELKTISLKINEATELNGRLKKKEYKLEIEFPDKLIKTVYAPSVNKGEIYKYNGKKKEIYYPMFEEYILKDIDEDENYIMGFFKDLEFYNRKKTSIKTSNKEVLYDELDRVKEIKYSAGTKVLFLNYFEIDSSFIPGNIEVYEKDSLISKLDLSDVEVNPNFSIEKFMIKSK